MFTRPALILFALTASSLTGQEQMIAHVTRVGGGFETIVYLENQTSSAADYRLTPFDETGSAGPVAEGSLPMASVASFTPGELFPGFAVSHFLVEGADIKVSAAYTAAGGPGSPAHVGGNETRAGRYRLFTGNWNHVFDGFAVVNTGTRPVDIWVTRKDFQDRALKTVRAIPALAPMAKGLYVIGGPGGSEFSPTDNSYFEVHASEPLALTALRGTLPNAEFLWVNAAEVSRPEINKVNDDLPGSNLCEDPTTFDESAADLNNMPQGEVWIAVADDGRLAAAAKDFRFGPIDDTTYNRLVWDGLYLSNDAGNTWRNLGFQDSNPQQGLTGVTDGSYGQPADQDIFLNHETDPVVAFDRDGNLYTCALAYESRAASPSFSSDPSAVVVSRRDANGELVAGTTHFLGLEDDATLFNDKNWIAVDRTSAVENTIVAVTWRLFTDGPNPTLPEGGYVVVSGDGAASFGTPIALPIPPAQNRSSQFYQPLIGKDPETGRKTLYILFRTANPNDFSMIMHLIKATIDGLEPGTQALHDFLSQPSNWTYMPNRITGLFVYGSGGYNGAFRFNSIFMPAIDENGHIYAVVEAYEPASQGSRTVISRSVNGGSVWTTPVEIDYPRHGHQMMPAVAVSDGVVSVVWYDSRHEPGDFVPFSLIRGIDVYYAELTTNLVLTRVMRLTKQTQRSDHPVFTLPRTPAKRGSRLYPHDIDMPLFQATGFAFPKTKRDPADCDGYGFIGDYIGIAADKDYSYAVWCDLRDLNTDTDICGGHACDGRRNQNIYFARIPKQP